MYSSIFNRFRILIAEVANVRRYVITTNTYFETDLGMTKENLAELKLRTENEFDIKLPENIFKEFDTVGEIVGFIESELGR